MARTYKFTNQGGDTTVSVSHTYSPGDVVPKGTGVLIESSKPRLLRLEVTDRSGFIDNENDLIGPDNIPWPFMGDLYKYSREGNGVIWYRMGQFNRLLWKPIHPYAYLIRNPNK